MASTSLLFITAGGVPQNLTEHSWIYSQGTMDDMRIYQSEIGFNGQKMVTGTRGTGTVSRTIDAQVYGGFEDGYNEIFANEWGVYQNRPSRYAAPITNSELKNALCAKKSLALVVVSVLSCAALLEVGVRLFDPQPAIRYRYSPDTFYEPIPGARFTYRRTDFAIPIAYNSWGMRDVERSLAKPPGPVRVALLGDSQVESKEVPLDSTFGQILERRFREHDPGPPIELLNFGVSGFGTVATLARFRSLASRCDPDLVVYFFMDNDLTDNQLRDSPPYTPAGEGLEPHRLPTDPSTRAFAARSIS